MTAAALEEAGIESPTEEQIIRAACRFSFERFVRVFWAEVPGAAPLVWSWHLSVLCKELQYIAERVFKNLPVEHDLIFNVPPGTSKSSIASILFPAWIWTRMPQARILSSSNTNDLVMDLATKARSVITGDLYRRCFPEIELTQDQDVKTYYRNTLGGDRYTCTVSGRSPIGFHAHFHLSDDLLDPKKARSTVELLEARNFVTDVLPSRKVDKAVTPHVLIMQRLWPGDPTDVMEEAARKEGGTPVRKICLPAELSDKVHPPEMRERYVDGLLDPRRLSKAVLKAERARMTNHAYEAQYGQNPVPPGGSQFKEHWFNQRVRSAPYACKRVVGVDRASTQDGGCFTSCTLLARDQENKCFIEDQTEGQWEPDERNDRILALAHRYRGRYGERHEPRFVIEMEGGSSGIDAAKTLGRKLAGFKFEFVHVTGTKDVRAEGWASHLASLNVWLVDNGEGEGLGKAAWDINGYVQEHVRFRPEPGKRLGGFKDRVDSSSLAYNYLFNKVRPAGHLPLRKVNFSDERKGGPPVRFIVVPDSQKLGELVLQEPSLLFYFCDPPVPGEEDPRIPAHGCESLQGSAVLTFLDVEAADLQDVWGNVLHPYGKTPEHLMANKEQARRLWSVLLRQHPKAPKFVLFVGSHEADGRPLSAALACADALNYQREKLFVSLSDSDSNYGKQTQPPGRTAYEAFRSGRNLVRA